VGTEDEKPKVVEAVAPRSAAPAAPVATVATVEHWARTKGMLPEFTAGQVDAGRLKRAPRSRPPQIHNPSFGKFSAAKNSLGWDPTNWPTMTEAEFDKAIAAATAHAYH
jgi:hypothetical protein